MLRKILDWTLSKSEEGKPLHFTRPLVKATDAFFYQVPTTTKHAPHVRDAVDLKRWMILVVVALIPAILMAIWNTGLQKFVYTSGDYKLIDEYMLASTSFGSYFAFASKYYLIVLQYGLAAFLPVVFISYAVGGFWEVVFACIRRHEISEGFLVTGMLFPLILPPTLPYWMIALGISFGVVVGKELFGGVGMNILNPALAARCFVFFAFPAKMSGDVYVGTNTTAVAESLKKMNETAPVDGYTRASPLTVFNVDSNVKRVHVDAIAANSGVHKVGTKDVIESQLDKWQSGATIEGLSGEQLQEFVTTPLEQGGLDLAPDLYNSAADFSALKYEAHNSNFFFGNQIGCFGETSVFACLLGALFLVYVGIGAWRTMVAMGFGAFICAFIFQFCAERFGADGGAWNSARFVLPAYKHLLLGGFAFGLAFMATDPVSSPGLNISKWIYGALIGVIVIMIRVVNPAFPEGVMLAILFGNIFAPLIDHYAVRKYRRTKNVIVK